VSLLAEPAAAGLPGWLGASASLRKPPHHRSAWTRRREQSVEQQLYMQYNWAALFGVAAVVFVVIALGLAALIRPHRPEFTKLTTYECGEQPCGQAWMRFNVRYYIIALVFLVFDVDVIFIFPWAVAFRLLVFGERGILFEPIGRSALGEMGLFLGVLLIAWLYAYKRGALDWV